MLAQQLARVLTELSRASDVTCDDVPSMEQRFKSLRGCNRLPGGREDRVRALTDEQIVAAVLGLVAIKPGWAGHVATIISRLKPVGGPTNAFGGADDLTSALCHLLTDDASRRTLVAVRLSVAEAGTNSNGIAVITSDEAGERKQLAFVRDEAVSLLRPGDAAAEFDSAFRNAPVSRELVLNRHFFHRLASKVDSARKHPLPPTGDGAEYDVEDQEAARRKRLGATPQSRFLNIGVDNQVTWPSTEMRVGFDRYDFVLMPKTKENVQSVHIDLTANRLTTEEAMTVINRFLSVMTWCDDQYAIAEHGWGGGPVPVAVRTRNLAFTTAYHWLYDRDIPGSDEARRALAMYREARNAEQNHMISYAVLNYYKVIEIHHPGWPASTKWVAENLRPILNNPHDQHGIATFLEACGEEKPEMYIYAACRSAVAHASPNRKSDPDDTTELRRLHNAADVMRRLARRFIALELGVSDSPFPLAYEVDEQAP